MNGHMHPVLVFSVWILPVIFAVTLHEAAHGYAALLFGDRTALMMGRVSLNPVRHIDPWGTLVFPTVALLMGGPLFGWAKPVPVNFRALRHPRRDGILVALAGPGANLVLATLSMALLYAAQYLPLVARSWGFQNLQNSITINLLLMIFNLLPIPPLDGGRVAVGILPGFLARPLASMERYGILVVLAVFMLVPLALGPGGQAYNPFIWLVSRPALWVEGHLAMMLGLA